MKKIFLLILFIIFNVNPLWAEEVNTTAVKEQVNPVRESANIAGDSTNLNGVGGSTAFSNGVKIDITYEKDLLSVNAHSVNLKELFEEIAKKTKIEVVIDKEAGEQKISVEFKELSLKQGIEKIIDLTGLKDLAISYKENEVDSQGKKIYMVGKVEIKKRYKQNASLSLKKQQKDLSKSEIKSILDEVDKILLRPDTAGSQIMITSSIDALYKESDKLIPYIKPYLDSEKMLDRKFAIDLLNKINSEESLLIMCNKFWSIYSNAYNVDKITAISASLAYFNLKINMDIPGVNNYWESRYIFKKLLENKSKCLDELSQKLISNNDGIAVMATKYMWQKNGEMYKDSFYRFSRSNKNSELFFTFLDELVKILESENLVGIVDLKKNIKMEIISLVENDDVGEAIFVKAIRYLSLGEPSLFAENWVELYQKLKNTNGKRIALEYEVSKNEQAMKNIVNLKKILQQNEFDLFDKSFKRILDRKKNE